MIETGHLGAAPNDTVKNFDIALIRTHGENFENRVALVGAEIARIEGREFDAERLYEQAVGSVRANGFIYNEALAYELAARF
jgi:hypothetical protein